MKPYILLSLCALKVVDCRVCGDPNSVLRFAFLEFTDEGMPSTFLTNWAEVVLRCIISVMLAEGTRNALSLARTMLGYYPVRVSPSKTTIAPVNPNFGIGLPCL
ncbi:hypothetical protein LguiB_034558 [Lonicera macranthoides]